MHSNALLWDYHVNNESDSPFLQHVLRSCRYVYTSSFQSAHRNTTSASNTNSLYLTFQHDCLASLNSWSPDCDTDNMDISFNYNEMSQNKLFSYERQKKKPFLGTQSQTAWLGSIIDTTEGGVDSVMGEQRDNVLLDSFIKHGNLDFPFRWSVYVPVH